MFRIPKDPKHVGDFNCLFKILIHVDFNLLSFKQLSAFGGQ